jgi:TolB-like protein
MNDPVQPSPQRAHTAAATEPTHATRPTVSLGSDFHSTVPPSGAPALPEQFGRYRIIKQIGRGGMGSVYLAHDTQLDRPVALKVPHFSAADGPEVLERFTREARAAATIDHPNICPVHDVSAIDGIHYVTMAYIDGQRLSDLIEGGKPLRPRSAAVLVRKLALALAEAHRHGVIHRDLKPSNVMVRQSREPVIMDFGLARRIHQDDVRLTRSGAILGTPAYMAPEQVRGDVATLGPGCDIYSLGVILYELLTGRLPFQGPTAALLAQVLTQDPPRPSQLRADLAPALEVVCLKAMARNVEDRFRTMGEFATVLGQYLKAGRGRQPASQALVAGIGEGDPDRGGLPAGGWKPAGLERVPGRLGRDRCPASPDRAAGLTDTARPPRPSADLGLPPARRGATGRPPCEAQAPSAAGPVARSGGFARLIGCLALAALAAGVGYFLLAPAAPVGSLIVLPIEAPSGDPELESLADALTNGIITDAALSGRIKFAPQEAVARAGAAGPPAAVGRQLGVDAVLTGKLARQGDRITLDAELINVRTSRPLWRDDDFQALEGHERLVVADWAPFVAAGARHSLDAHEKGTAVALWEAARSLLRRAA